jgi:triphosphoribosyl-dephospho-CoA synthase
MRRHRAQAAGVNVRESSPRAEFGRAAFVRACTLDVAVRKPGNVSAASPGHGMEASLFVASAVAAAGPISSAGAAVGERVEAAVRAACEASGCNTNLGIVLLCAPLLAAFERGGGAEHLRTELESVLHALDVEDARAAYRAIVLARPGGLGRATEQDVRDTPTTGLRQAMALAAHRDRIAWQYLHGFADVFELGLPVFLAAADPATAMVATFLELLAALPDSHIVRKHGDVVAQSVMAQALPWRDRARSGERLADDPAFARWDQDLKARGLNPGTSADLCVATALAADLQAAASRFP